MSTLQVALRVADRDAAVTFYEALGYELIGEVAESPLGHLTMLKLRGDEHVSLELVHDPSSSPVAETTLSHIAVQVESLEETVSRLAAAGIGVEPIASPGPGLHTTCICDPDGRRIELVEWPPGHPDGLTAADWAQEEENR
jgi:lactoylglutathione lyase